MSWRNVARRLKDSMRDNPADFWISVATVAATLVLGAGALILRGDFVWAVLIAQTAMGALGVRYGFHRPKGEAGSELPLFPFFVPLASTVLGAWWIIPVLADDEVPGLAALFLWLLISTVASLASIFAALFAVLPLELIGRAFVAMIRGRFVNASASIVGALYLVILPAFCAAGYVALGHSLPPYPRGSYVAFAALLGIDGSYTVENEGALWLARGLLVLLIIPALGAVRLRRDAR